MDTNYRFSNLIGSVYRNGNVLFTPDGNSVISPVGNKISIFDLKNNVSRTIALESQFSIVSATLNYCGSHLIVTNEGGHVLYINLATETVVHTFRANRTVKALEFSPDGRALALCRDNDLQIHDLAHFNNASYYPFFLRETYHISGETLTTVNWSHDSRLIVTGGEDKIVRIVGSKRYKNLYIHPLGSHKGTIITAQFLQDSYDLLSVDAHGFCQLWTSSLVKGDLEEGEWTKPVEGEEETVARLYYEKTKSFSVIEAAGSGKTSIVVSAAHLHSKTGILVTAFSNGVFVLHEIPTFSLIHNLRVSEMKVNTACFNSTGDWLALGCGTGSAAQLVVWEWQSETYVMKQQAHSQRVMTAEFSPDGALVATGAEDGKVKIWNGRTAFCTVTFDEHTSAVAAVCWTQNGKAILSASLDGTIRAHDLKRYRNFRTLVCPEPTQLASLAVDKAGDIVCAAGKEVFNIFIWSMENGRLLDVLAGHQSNISWISIHGNTLASSSWDRTIKMWSIVDSSCESTELSQEGLAVEFSPCGQMLVALTIDSNLTFYRADDMSQVGSIEAKLDLDPARGQNDLITRQNAAQSKSFTCLKFSPDGVLLLLGGESNNFCLYSVPDKLLVRKFTITQNRSLDGVVLDVNRRNFSEFGNMALVDVSDSDEEPDHRRQVKLPGTKHMDLGERSSKPEVAVYNVAYCPTGRRFAVCSTEGVGVYSLDTVGFFDPFQLDSQTSPKQVKRYISLGDHGTAVMASLRLNDTPLIKLAMESTPLEQIPLVVRSLPVHYAEKLLKWMADGTIVWSSTYVHFYMLWLRHVLHVHGLNLKGRADVAVLTGVQQIVSHHQQLIARTADQNKFGLRYLLASRKLKRKEVAVAMEED